MESYCNEDIIFCRMFVCDLHLVYFLRCLFINLIAAAAAAAAAADTRISYDR